MFTQQAPSVIRESKMSTSPGSNNFSFEDIEYVRQLVYYLSLNELQQILKVVNQSTFGDKLHLQKHVLFLLKDRAPKTKLLRLKIVQIYNSRLQQPRLQMNSQSDTSPRPNSIEPSVETPSPDIQFECLPFFKTVKILLKPSACKTNIDSTKFIGLFDLTDDAKHSVVKSWNIARQEYTTQVILRLLQVGLDENGTERLPYNIKVTVNSRECKLPELNFPTETGTVPWRCNVPIDLTQQAELKHCVTNVVTVTWSQEPHQYMAGVYISQKLTWNDLLVELKSRPVRPADKTKELIQNSLENDADMGVDTIFATVKDPLSKLRMQLPARGVDCIHLQCFDAIQFLQMNEHRQKWKCPLCKKKIKFQNIEVDEFFLNIVQSSDLSKECENVVLLKDGTWSERKNKEFSNNSRRNNDEVTENIEVFTLSDSDNDNDEIFSKPKRFKTNPRKREESVIQTKHIRKIIDLTSPSKSDHSTSSVSDSSKYEPVNLDTVISNPGSNNYAASSSSRIIINNTHKKKIPLKPVLCVITLD